MGKTFFERYYELCKERGETPNSVAKQIGGSSGSVTAWKQKGTIPKPATLTKLADYFNVSIDYLICKTDERNESEIVENKKTPVLTAKDERDIAKNLEAIMADLEHSGNLMFDGNPMSDEARESMRNAIELGLKTVKLLNKETYTPKKYK